MEKLFEDFNKRDVEELLKTESIDPRWGHETVGLDNHWALGIALPLTGTDKRLARNLWSNYHFAANMAINYAKDRFPGKIGDKLPENFYSEVNNLIKDVALEKEPRLPSRVRDQLVQLAFHRKIPLQDITYLTIDKRIYNLLLPHPNQEARLAGAFGLLEIKTQPKIRFLLWLGVDKLTLGATLGRLKFQRGVPIKGGFTVYPTSVRARWRYIPHNQVWTDVLALIEKTNKHGLDIFSAVN